ncbi:SDR family oxidoreductase [Streptomyces sp. MAR4 CNX-425]|uniref:SDR family oxidoreductase n=1 Tax=Streptomyces sp. MAR4 CNX-425 TaxID=3406343 RepID=UPI003B505FE8
MALNGRTALVTGGSRGIGRAIVTRLARDGARVVFTYKENEAAADEVLRAVPGTRAVRADQERPEALAEAFAPVRDGLDILVNNAAVNPRMPLAELTAAEFDRVMAANARFGALAMREAAALMPDEGGRIVNISTLNTAVPAPGHALYCASKAVLEQFTRVAARELGPRGITVNAVSPGATETDLLHATNPPEALVQSAAFTALQRLGRPEDIAAVVAFLAGPDAAWVTGQNIRATGGLLV